jgi:Uri superfamily endonuclease
MFPPVPGTYALLLRCPTAHCIRIGRLDELQLRPGHYIYVGSAFGPGGLRARIGHHQSAVQRPHWHIDYQRTHTLLESILYRCGARVEHEWAGRIATMRGAVVPMLGFGSSDCECVAHLYWFEDALVAALQRALGRPAVFTECGREPVEASPRLNPSFSRLML